MPLLGMLGNPLLKWGLVAVVIGGLFLWARAEGYRADAAGQRAAVATEAARTSAATAKRLEAEAGRNAELARISGAELERIQRERANAHASIVRVPRGPDQCRDLLRAVADGLPRRADGAGRDGARPSAAGKPRVAVPARP